MTMLYRAMRADQDRRPETGEGGRALGARPGTDLPVVEGLVHPGSGGMSVTADEPRHLPKHRRPPWLGGEARDPLFRLPATLLGAHLSLRSEPQGSSHRLVEPARIMEFGAYQQHLRATREDWSLCAVGSV